VAAKTSADGRGDFGSTTQPKRLYDFVRSLEAGMNAGIDPLLLQRNQASFLRNATVRGTFLTHRPPYTKIISSFSSPDVQTAATQALWQGACYFKSDDGVESLMALVGGRLFRYVINGQNATVSERTTPSLQQSPTSPQAWLWPAERWTIVQDGLNLPLFDDGITIRRSLGSNSSTAATTLTNTTRVAVNGTLTFQLAGPFTGPVPSTVLVGGFKYSITNVVANSNSAYTLTLKFIQNLVAGGSLTYPVGSLVKRPYPGWALATSSLTLNKNQSGNLDIDRSFEGGIGDQLAPFGANDAYTFISRNPDPNVPNSIGITLTTTGPRTINVGALLHVTSIPTTYATVATTSAQFNVTTVGQSVTVQLSTAYTGTIGELVRIGDSAFEVTAYTVDTTQQYNATATNINDTTGVGTTINAGTALLLPAFELPAGRMGAYGKGRNWMSLLDGRGFVASDIVGSTISGTQNYNFRDSVLSMQENDLLFGGGNFLVPGQQGDIRAMIFAAQLDTSLGQGPLLVFTPDIVFSCEAPVDRSTWQTVTNPILTEPVKVNGAQGQDSTINVNSDTWYRSNDGKRTVIMARRDFDVWGNVPISREIDPIISQDDPTLLSFISTIEFDNRVIETLNPVQSPLGVYHNQLDVVNNDQISSLQGKGPSVYDGIWDGLNVLKLVTGSFLGVKRAFAFCLNSTLDTIELWEILPSSTMTIQDDTGPIVWEMQSAALNFYETDPRRRDFIRLLNGEIKVDCLNYAPATSGPFAIQITTPHSVFFETFYKSDQFPTWTPWHSFTVTFDPNTDPGFRPTLGLGAPNAKVFDNVNEGALREFTTMQFRIRITGHCRFLNARMLGSTVQDLDFAPPM
jgi:hypothetical protein